MPGKDIATYHGIVNGNSWVGCGHLVGIRLVNYALKSCREVAAEVLYFEQVACHKQGLEGVWKMRMAKDEDDRGDGWCNRQGAQENGMGLSSRNMPRRKSRFGTRFIPPA